MREYLSGYRDAIEKVFEIHKDKPGFPSLKQALLEDYFEKSSETGPTQRYTIPDKAYPALGHPAYCGSVSTSLSGSAALKAFNLTGNDDIALLESKEL